MSLELEEILSTIRMTSLENLDVRTVTLGLNLIDCIGDDFNTTVERVRDKILRYGEKLVPAAEHASSRYGVKIVNKRIALTPLSIICGKPRGVEEYIHLGKCVDDAATSLGIDFIGGYSALVHKGMTPGEEAFMESIPDVLSVTNRLCSSINLGTSKAGINMDAVRLMGIIIKRLALNTKDSGGIGCAKLVVFANIPEDNPFMAGAMHGIGEGDAVLNVGVSGPGVVHAVVKNLPEQSDFGSLSDAIKQTAFKITRLGELVGREVAKSINVPFGVLDLSLAPTPAVGDSVADILEAMGLPACGGHGTTAALALLNDAVKKGGVFASSYIGGLSGAFIPVSEDRTMAQRAAEGVLTIDKLEAMTAVCSVGLDMIAIPGDTTAATISAIIADEVSIGIVNNKTTAVRVIPVPDKKAGDEVDFGGLLGKTRIIPIHTESPDRFINRGGRIPAPMHSIKN